MKNYIQKLRELVINVYTLWRKTFLTNHKSQSNDTQKEGPSGVKPSEKYTLHTQENTPETPKMHSVTQGKYPFSFNLGTT